jgi:hypothetical protein
MIQSLTSRGKRRCRSQCSARRAVQCSARRAGFVAALGAVLSLGFLVTSAAAQQPQLEARPNQNLSTRDLNVWGRFSPGAWKQVRIVTETLNDKGDVTATTTNETKFTLVSVSAKSLKLKIETMVDVSGKRFGNESREIEYGFFSEQPSEPGEVKLLGAAHVTIGGERLPCQVRQVTARSSGGQHVTKLYLSETVEPFVLKRETSLIAADGKPAANSTSTVEVIALDMLVRTGRETKSAAMERTIQRTPSGTHEMIDWTCVDIPGGIVSRTSKESDEKGKLLRRSTMELVDYHAELEEASGTGEDGPRYLSRRQARKAARRGR